MAGGRIEQGTPAWFDMVGTVMRDAAERAGLPADRTVSLVERYTDGVDFGDGLVQGIRFDIVGGSIRNWWRQGMMNSAKAHYEGIKAFSETDQTEDLKAISVPTLVLNGEDDRIVPIDNSARRSVTLLRNATLKTYPGFSHGMMTVNADVLDADLLAFVRG